MMAFLSKIWKILNKNLVATILGGIITTVVVGSIVGYILWRIQEGTPIVKDHEKEEVQSPEANTQTPTNQPVIIDTTNSKKQVLEAQATNVAPSTVETPPEPKAGEVQKFILPGGIELEMVYCPETEKPFTMGSPDGESEYPKGSGEKPEAELGRFNDETPHEVRLTKGYWIGQYPVTQIQYKAITGENPSHFKGNTRPVEMVSWNDSVAFCERLNELKIAPAGYRFALPTEAQWEYACRAGTTTALNNGKPLTSARGECPNLDEVGWYSENSELRTHPVGEKRPNEWWIYDMHGNVWEWCTDWYGDYPLGAEDPTGPETGGSRVLRGGSWGSFARNCRSARRGSYGSVRRYYDLGFRLALVPE